MVKLPTLSSRVFLVEQIPKEEGFERRKKLYKLYHYLNQLNLFGDPKVRETVETLTDEILNG